MVALVSDGRRTVRVAGGSARLKPQQPMQVNDRFRIASLTKTFVAAVVAQLAGEAKLTFEDTVERWLPGTIPNGQNITLRQLLDHRSGLFDYSKDPQVTAPYLQGNFAFAWTPGQLIAIANAHPPLFPPGTRTSYSNTNFIVLGQIIQAVTGRPVQTELRERLFKPLKLRSTFYATGQRIPGPHAHGYFMPRPGTLQDTTDVSPTHAGAAGAIVSTAADVARFYRALFSGRVVRPDLVREMQTIKDGWGLDLHTSPSRCGVRLGHDGAIPGYNSTAMNTGDGQRQLVLLANSLTPDDKVGDAKAQRHDRGLAASGSITPKTTEAPQMRSFCSRRRRDSNPSTRLCRPLRSHSATSPSSSRAV
ncbi:MAG: beta-lactamase class [Solirubrobacterales bacterium]|nr:beta-lactamase class [Solirubrobacterales bacterium]